MRIHERAGSCIYLDFSASPLTAWDRPRHIRRRIGVSVPLVRRVSTHAIGTTYTDRGVDRSVSGTALPTSVRAIARRTTIDSAGRSYTPECTDSAECAAQGGSRSLHGAGRMAPGVRHKGGGLGCGEPVHCVGAVSYHHLQQLPEPFDSSGALSAVKSHRVRVSELSHWRIRISCLYRAGTAMSMA